MDSLLVRLSVRFSCVYRRRSREQVRYDRPHPARSFSCAPAALHSHGAFVTGRVLVARLDSVGDVLLAGPAVRAVASGADEVLLLVGPHGAEAAALLPGVDRVAIWACPWIMSPPPAVTRGVIEELNAIVAAFKPDQAVILTSFHQSPLPLALLLRQAGVARITAASVDYPGSLLDVRLRPGEDFPEDQPEPFRALCIAEAAGFHLPEADDGLLRLVPLPHSPEMTFEQPYIVVHPGASAPARQWPAGHYAEAVRLLVGEGLRILVTGGPGERGLTAQVAGNRARDLGGLTDLPTLAGILAGASVVVTGNTGPAHLAAAVGTCVVSLFAPVVPAVRWAPYGVPVVLLGDQDAPCRNSRATRCPVQGHPCLTSVLPADVVEACWDLMRPPQDPARGLRHERTGA
jgi:ADP-heptose:LPS heptosyltransferase